MKPPVTLCCFQIVDGPLVATVVYNVNGQMYHCTKLIEHAAELRSELEKLEQDAIVEMLSTFINQCCYETNVHKQRERWDKLMNLQKLLRDAQKVSLRQYKDAIHRAEPILRDVMPKDSSTFRAWREIIIGLVQMCDKELNARRFPITQPTRISA